MLFESEDTPPERLARPAASCARALHAHRAPERSTRPIVKKKEEKMRSGISLRKAMRAQRKKKQKKGKTRLAKKRKKKKKGPPARGDALARGKRHAAVRVKLSQGSDVESVAPGSEEPGNSFHTFPAST